jgi:hypothetical protein
MLGGTGTKREVETLRGDKSNRSQEKGPERKGSLSLFLSFAGTRKWRRVSNDRK